jgi:hypothetical protein
VKKKARSKQKVASKKQEAERLDGRERKKLWEGKQY